MAEQRPGDIEPPPKPGLAALLDAWAPFDEAFPEIEDAPATPKDIF